MSARITTKNSDDVESYLQTGWPTTVIATLLKSSGKDQNTIDAEIEKYQTSRNKIRKYIKRFISKIENKYGSLDQPDLINKGMKFAKKHNFTKAEEEAFINQVKSGDIDHPYSAFDEMPYSDMSKFLGFSSLPTFLDVKATDHASLDEIAVLYEESLEIHRNVKLNLNYYKKSCDYSAVIGRYNRERDDISVFIHPVVVALFLPKIQALEKRMLISNIGRLVIQRAPQLVSKYKSYASTMTLQEKEIDMLLMGDIAKDPNSMNYFNDESPMVNLLKRFKIQVELYKNVKSLRNGIYYKKLGDSMEDDDVAGLQVSLQQYNQYFDGPDYASVQDEGTFLRKLLAVFSLRPTFTQLSSYTATSITGQVANLGTSKISFMNTPIINVRLPRLVGYPNVEARPGSIQLKSALQQNENFIENKMIVPKHKVVFQSNDVLFFYINRRYHSVNLVDHQQMSLCYMSLPGTISGLTNNVNKTPVIFDEREHVGSQAFNLQSVVVLNEISSETLNLGTLGCSTIVKANQDDNRSRPVYFYYNPTTANIPFVSEGQLRYNHPIMVVPEFASEAGPGFQDMATTLSTIFVYSV